MLRLIHTQTVTGPIIIDDIDDGLPNKTAHRLGSSGDPKVMPRDGYANAEKQPCVVPRNKIGETAIAGYIDLRETPKVALSAAKGKIYKHQQAGRITVASILPTDLAAPTISGATRNTPGAGDLTISGTNFVSVAPDVSTVIFTGAGVGSKTLTSTQILAGTGGVFSATSIVIDTLLIAGLTAGDKVSVRADGRTTAAFTIS